MPQVNRYKIEITQAADSGFFATPSEAVADVIEKLGIKDQSRITNVVVTKR